MENLDPGQAQDPGFPGLPVYQAFLNVSTTNHTEPDLPKGMQ